MFISELAEPRLLVIYPGRFQPFHKGHHAVYQYLTGKFGSQNVYIATSNKTDNIKSPFTFSEKNYFMQLTGVPGQAIIECDQPYKIENLLNTGRITITDPDNTVVIFAVSEKDMAEDPRFKSWTKKDGSPSYFQPLENIKDTKSLNEYSYIMTVPTFDFKVLGQPMRSGTELRRMYADSDENTRKQIVKDLFGKYTHEAEKIMTAKIAPVTPVEPVRPTKLPKTPKPVGGLVKESTTPQAQQAAKALQLGLQKYQQLYPNLDHAFATGFIDHIEPDGTVVVAGDNSTTKIKAIMAQGGGAQFKVVNQEQLQLSEVGGVGVVKNSNDPRYSTATMGDNNDVDGNTLGKEMRAYHLTKESNSTHIVKNPETGEMDIRPAGGFGTWSEPTLTSSLLRDLQAIEAKVQAKNASDAEYILYQKYSTVKAKLQALARYEEFMQKNGRRPIKPGREIELPNKEM
jgi:hypothetical protein